MRRAPDLAAVVAVALGRACSPRCCLATAGGYVPDRHAGRPAHGREAPRRAPRSRSGSKNFSEKMLLGKMAIILMQSDGAKVNDLTNIPGSASARQAMLDGQIEAMWEYTGTGWIAYLGHDKPIPDEEKQYTAVRDEDLKKNDLDWLKPAPMNNTYGFAVTRRRREVRHHQAVAAEEGARRSSARSASSPS